MNDNQKLGIISLAAIAVVSMIASNIVTIYRLGEVERKIDNTEESIHEIKQEVDTIKESVREIKQEVDTIKESLYDSGIKLAISEEEKKCLAKNIFFEAGVEPPEGKIAVAQVTINRLESGRWGDNVCSVVYARKQFSWTLDKKKVNEKPSGPLWKETIIALEKFLEGKRVYGLEQSKHYHATYIEKPYWSKKKEVISTIGRHVFYMK